MNYSFLDYSAIFFPIYTFMAGIMACFCIWTSLNDLLLWKCYLCDYCMKEHFFLFSFFFGKIFAFLLWQYWFCYCVAHTFLEHSETVFSCRHFFYVQSFIPIWELTQTAVLMCFPPILEPEKNDVNINCAASQKQSQDVLSFIIFNAGEFQGRSWWILCHPFLSHSVTYTQRKYNHQFLYRRCSGTGFGRFQQFLP